MTICGIASATNSPDDCRCPEDPLAERCLMAGQGELLRRLQNLRWVDGSEVAGGGEIHAEWIRLVFELQASRLAAECMAMAVAILRVVTMEVGKLPDTWEVQELKAVAEHVTTVVEATRGDRL